MANVDWYRAAARCMSQKGTFMFIWGCMAELESIRIRILSALCDDKQGRHLGKYFRRSAGDVCVPLCACYTSTLDTMHRTLLGSFKL